MLDQLIRDFTNNIARGRGGRRPDVGNLRLLEDDAREAREASAEWGAKAQAASRPRRRAPGGQGNTAEADRFDGLAKIALRRQISLRGAGPDASTTRSPSRPSSPTSSRTASTSCASSARSWSRSATSSSAARRWPRPRCRSSRRSRASPSWTRPRSSTASRSGSAARRRRRAGMEEVAASSLEDQFAELETRRGRARGRGAPRGAQGQVAGLGRAGARIGRDRGLIHRRPAHGRGRASGPFFMPGRRRRLRLRPPARSRFG